MRCLRIEATSPLRQTSQRRSPIDGQLLSDKQVTTATAAGADVRRPTKGRSKHSDTRCVSVDSIIAAAASKVCLGCDPFKHRRCDLAYVHCA